MSDITGNLGEALHDNGDGTFSLSVFQRGVQSGTSSTANQGTPNAGGASAWPVQAGDGGIASLGTTTDGASALTLIGRVKQLLTQLPASLGIKMSANSLPVVLASDQAAVPVNATRAATTVLNQASAAQAAGNSGALTVGAYAELAVDVNVTAFTGGTAPTITFFLDRQGADGIWYQIYAGTAISAAGAQSTSLGVGATVPAAFGGTARLRWTLGGTVAPTSVTFSASIIGK